MQNAPEHSGFQQPSDTGQGAPNGLPVNPLESKPEASPPSRKQSIAVERLIAALEKGYLSEAISQAKHGPRIEPTQELIDALASRIATDDLEQCSEYRRRSHLDLLQALKLPENALEGKIIEKNLRPLLKEAVREEYFCCGDDVSCILSLCDVSQAIRDAAFVTLVGLHYVDTETVKKAGKFREHKFYKSFSGIMEKLEPQKEAFFTASGESLLAMFIRSGEMRVVADFPKPDISKQREVAEAILSCVKNIGYDPVNLEQVVTYLELPLHYFQTSQAQALGRSFAFKAHLYRPAREALEATARVFGLSAESIYKEVRKRILLLCKQKLYAPANTLACAVPAAYQLDLKNLVTTKIKAHLQGGNIVRRNLLEPVSKFFRKEKVGIACLRAGLTGGGLALGCLAFKLVEKIAPYTGSFSLSGYVVGVATTVMGGIYGALFALGCEQRFVSRFYGKQRDVSFYELRNLKLSQEIITDPLVRSRINKEIISLFEEGAIEQAFALADQFEIALDAEEHREKFIRKAMKEWRAYEGHAFVEGFASFLNYFKLSKEEKRALFSSEDMLDAARSLLWGVKDYNNFNEICELLELCEEEKKDFICALVLYKEDFSSGHSSFSFALIDAFNLSVSDFNGKFDELKEEHIDWCIKNNKLYSLERFLVFLNLAADDEVFQSKDRKEAILHWFSGSRTCPDVIAGIGSLLQRFSLLPSMLPQNERLELQGKAAGWCEAHVKNYAFSEAILVSDMFDVAVDILGKEVQKQAYYLIKNTKDAELATVLEKFGATFTEDFSEHVQQAAIYRAFRAIAVNKRDLSELMVRSFGLEQDALEEYALGQCRAMIQSDEHAKIITACEPWGVDEHTSVEKIFPETSKYNRKQRESYLKKGIRTLGDIIEAYNNSPRARVARTHGKMGYTSEYDAKRLAESPGAVNAIFEFPYYRQQRNYACAAGSARMVLEALTGDKLTEKRVVEIIRTTFEDGTPLGNFSEIQEAYPNIDCLIKQEGSIDTLKNLTQQGYALIVNYSPFGPHYAVIKTVTDEALVLYDPSLGKNTIFKSEQFLSCWHGGYPNTGLTERGFVALKLREAAH